MWKFKSVSADCFSNCNIVKKVALGYESASFGSMPNSKVIMHVCFPNAITVPENAFLCRQELISCKLPIVSTIKDSAFNGCTRLVELEIPKVIGFKRYSIFIIDKSLNQSLVAVNPESNNLFERMWVIKIYFTSRLAT
mgnify:CR=1 FL=1